MIRNVIILYAFKRNQPLISKVPSSLFRSVHNSRYKFSEENVNFSDLGDEFVSHVDEPSKKVTFQQVLETYQSKFGVSRDEAKELVLEGKTKFKISLEKISQTFKLLAAFKISLDNINKNNWVITAPLEYLEGKLRAIENLEPRDINDFFPLINADTLALLKASNIVKKERNEIPKGNRIYYIADRLNIEPVLLSQYVAKHMFIFEVPFTFIINNLDLMLEFGMSSENIMRNLSAFRCFPSSARQRLERCRSVGMKNLKPWLMRTPDKRLNLVLARSIKKIETIGDKSIAEYLSERLNTDIEEMNYILSKNKKILSTHVPKIKDFLDFLLIEEKFTQERVLSSITILCHSLETTRQRLDVLKKLGHPPSTLAILCQSKRKYDSYINKILESKK
ncbi:CLUMA_CG012477, isoform A [Clunio marinus]|uniref:CLUMA_CG012477, isoform A n=1 Tax=Clunio marinus TaxID=568069 RepID=A0A1J1IHY1_9DIPT|nr:CLUMA_CG012477, isoform A [Clunio marinus]